MNHANSIPALEMFNQRHCSDLDTLQVLNEHKDIQQYYQYTAEIEAISPLSILLNHIAFITLKSGHLNTINIEESIVALCKSIFITAAAGLGKSMVMHLQRKRIKELSSGIRYLFSRYTRRLSVTSGYIRIVCKEHNLNIPIVIVHSCNKMYCIVSNKTFIQQQV